MRATLEEVRAEYMRLKGGPNGKATTTLFDLAAVMGWDPNEFKLALMQAEQTSTHISRSARRNRRRAKRQALMRERYGLTDPNFEAEVQNTMSILCDCVPYDDPDYHSKLRNMAEGVVRDMNDPNSSYNKMCEEHDRLLAEGKIDC